MARLLAIDLGLPTPSRSPSSTRPRVRWWSRPRCRTASLKTAPSCPRSPDRLAVLDALLRRHSAWTSERHDVVVAWPSDLASVRRLQLPVADKAKIAEMLPFAIEAEVPFRPRRDGDRLAAHHGRQGGPGHPGGGRTTSAP